MKKLQLKCRQCSLLAFEGCGQLCVPSMHIAAYIHVFSSTFFSLHTTILKVLLRWSTLLYGMQPATESNISTYHIHLAASLAEAGYYVLGEIDWELWQRGALAPGQ